MHLSLWGDNPVLDSLVLFCELKDLCATSKAQRSIGCVLEIRLEMLYIWDISMVVVDLTSWDGACLLDVNIKIPNTLMLNILDKAVLNLYRELFWVVKVRTGTEYFQGIILLVFCLNVCLGIVDGAILPTETRLPSSTRPHWLEPTIYSSEEDGLSRAASDGVGGDNLNMLSVAVKILSDKSESNTKVCAFNCSILLLIDC